ncbi:MAG: winged-helix domain-containing protein [Oligoflexales bacterium]
MGLPNILFFNNSKEGYDALTSQLLGHAKVHCASSLVEGLNACSADKFDVVLVGKSVKSTEVMDLCENLKERAEYTRTPIVILPEGGLGGDSHLRLVTPDQACTSAKPQSFDFDVFRQEVFLTDDKSKRRLQLTSTEFRILLHLSKNSGAVISRTELIANIWRGDSKISDRTVDKHISSLRKKLGTHGKRLKTLPNRGYVLALDG